MTQTATDKDVCNIANELLDAVKDNTASVIALDVAYVDKRGNTIWRQIWRQDKSSVGFEEFVQTRLNLFYNNGYGTQHIFGEVWLSDGSWFERDEYDGSEWWAHRTRPPLPSLSDIKEAWVDED